MGYSTSIQESNIMYYSLKNVGLDFSETTIDQSEVVKGKSEIIDEWEIARTDRNRKVIDYYNYKHKNGYNTVEKKVLIMRNLKTNFLVGDNNDKKNTGNSYNR